MDYFKNEKEHALKQYNLNEDVMIKLIGDAFNQMWSIINDHNLNKDDHFEIDGVQYSYFSPDKDTEEEIIPLLNKYYTENISKMIVEKFNINKKDNRLYRALYADHSTLRIWRKAEILDINKTSENNFEVIVKIPDSDFFYIDKIEFIYTDKGFRINSFLQY